MTDKPLEAIFYRNWNACHIPEILEEIYLKAVYQPFLLGKKDLIIVDIGANIGLTSHYFKNYAKQVYAIEPDPDHIEELSKMIEFNKIKNITVCPYAISNKTGKHIFYRNENTTANNLIGGQPGGESFDVDLLSFDEFMVKNNLDHIDLLKLDPEGEEGKIISSEGFKKYADKVKIIVGEWHNWGNIEQNQFANLFIDLGYEFRWLPNMKASVYTAVRI